MEAFLVSLLLFGIIIQFIVVFKVSKKCTYFCFRATAETKPSNLQDTLNACNESLYPNIHTILRLLSITPVTSATVERSNSSLRFVKNLYRTTMTEDRLNALLLLFIHKDIPLEYSAVVDMFASRNPRRMTFLNPLSD